MSSDLTKRQQQVLGLIEDQIRDQGRPPTLREIAGHFGFSSPNAARDHLKALANKGIIALEDGARGIRLLTESVMPDLPVPGYGMESPGVSLPLVGRVAAGSPILAEENIEEQVAVDPAIFGRADYLLRVHGDSMCEIGILNGDMVAVHRQPTANNGEIVVARLGEEVTVKRLKQDGATVALCPENHAYQVINVDLREQRLDIEGIVVGVIRTKM